MSNNQDIQKKELAGKTKLTAVTLGHGNHRQQFFIPLTHDSRGHAILPVEVLNSALSGLRRGDTFTVG